MRRGHHQWQVEWNASSHPGIRRSRAQAFEVWTDSHPISFKGGASTVAQVPDRGQRRPLGLHLAEPGHGYNKVTTVVG